MSTQTANPESERFTPFQRFLSSRLITGGGMWLSKNFSSTIGYLIADLISGLINRFRSDVYQVVYDNLQHVLGQSADSETLHRLVRQVFHNTARNYYDLWHLVSRGTEAIREAVCFSSGSLENCDRALARGKGVILVCHHSGNFDLSTLALVARRGTIQILGFNSPPAQGFNLMDRLRTQGGAHPTPINVGTLREAVERLRTGGIVGTGVDRPLNDVKPTVEFFGRLAALPTGHVRLALKTNAPILVGSAYRTPDGQHVAQLSPPIEMTRTGDKARDMTMNLRRVTEQIESAIRARPEQWAMFVPVWPT